MATAALQIPSTASISCIPQEFLYSSYSSSNLCLNTEKKIQKSSLKVTSNLISPSSSSKSFPPSIDYGKTVRLPSCQGRYTDPRAPKIQRDLVPVPLGSSLPQLTLFTFSPPQASTSSKLLFPGDRFHFSLTGSFNTK